MFLTGAWLYTDEKCRFYLGSAQSVREKAGYIDDTEIYSLNILDLQYLTNSILKVVIALVTGYALVVVVFFI